MSKKRSDSKSDQPPEPLVFFIDRSLGGDKVARALRNAGALVETHDEHFAIDAPDEIWLREVGLRGWVVLTKDRLRARPIEREALAAAGVRAFILLKRNISGDEMGQIFAHYVKRMTKLCAETSGSFIATIGGNGLQLERGTRRRPRRG